MCLAIPLKVIEIDGKYALGEAGNSGSIFSQRQGLVIM